MTGSYDYRLVAVSVFIAMLASYAALDLGGRVTASHGRLRAFWLTGGAAAMGMGIWSMHYIGMLAYNLPVTVYYNLPVVGLSLLAAVLASLVALFAVSRTRMGAASTVAGGFLMGIAITAMHYIGMEAMRLPAMCHYSPGLVGTSFALAVAISVVALRITFSLRGEEKSGLLRKIASAVLMGAAIPVMHYVGMGAVTFMPMEAPVDLTNSVAVSALGVVGIGGSALMILALAIVTSLVDRRFSAQSLQLQNSEQSYRQLVESAQVILWRASADQNEFHYINKEAEDVLGYATRTWTDYPGFWNDRLHPDDRDLASDRRTDTVTNGVSQLFEHRMIAADGRVVWLRTSIRLITSDEGKQELVGVMADITERKQAQEEIRRLNDQLRRENMRMSAELEVTQRLQQMMLPRDEEMRKIVSLDISGYMEPASEVGGDYYDVVSREGGVFFGIGDVTGHGLESGVIAIMVQTAVRTLLACGQYESGKFFDILNRVIYDNARRMNCDGNLTFSLLRYQDQFVTISGQHEEVIVVRRNGALERHDTLDLGFPLGLDSDISTFTGEARVALDAGDVMVLYTDGITEAINYAGFAYGIERLSEAVRSSHTQPSDGIRQSVLASLREYTGGRDLQDDISLLVIKPAEGVVG